MKVVFDTNIWISFLLGKKLSVLSEVLTRDDVSIYVSNDLLKELVEVASRPKIKQRISADSLMALLEMIDATCQHIDNYAKAESDIRDADDLYLISMVEAIPADYLVTGDKDLLVLIQQDKCKIITFAQFMEMLNRI